jgi:hypothetical protein
MCARNVDESPGLRRTGAALAMVSLQLGLVLDSGDLLRQWRH